MSKHKNTLAAYARAKAGKGAARATRRDGKIPGVIYGDNKEPALVSVDQKELRLALAKKGFFTQLCDLTVDGAKHLVLPRDVQVDPVYDRPEHVDFLRVSDKTIITVGVPLRVSNEKASPGITKGGVLNLIRHEIEVYCKATDIPDEFVVDLTGLDVGQTVHVSALNLPEGVKPVMQGDFTVITIVAPSALKSDEVAAGPAADAAAAPAAGAAAPAAGAKAGAPAAAAKGAAPAAAPAKGGKK
ncbi:MAG TPA: 50S ribosomal protein L25/general stress protein Ctc [Patescibacteria group bacterium]|nr:50S ribosomal protein L25/general stress protein Ctc [Patescibacteria group bacterium]